MSKGERKSETECDVQRDGSIQLSSRGDVDSTYETSLWNQVGNRKRAVESLLQDKLKRLVSSLPSVDGSPLTQDQLVEVVRESLRLEIEGTQVTAGQGGSLAMKVHARVTGCTARQFGRKDSTAKVSDWVQEQIRVEQWEEALRIPAPAEGELLQDIERGHSAKLELSKLYDRVAQHLARRRRGLGFPLDDLETIARTALWKAIQTFDITGDAKFRTYAHKVIDRSLIDALRESCLAGSHHARESAKFSDREQQLAHRLGRPASPAEVLESLQWSDAKKNHYLSGVPLAKAAPISSDVSDAPTPEPPSKACEPHAELERKEDRKRLDDALEQLDEITRTVIAMRLYSDEGALSQQEVADRLSLTRDRVRTIEKNGLASLKKALKSRDG